MSQQKLPSDWDEERANTVLKHYEEQTEDEAVAEDEAVLEIVESDQETDQ